MLPSLEVAKQVCRVFQDVGRGTGLRVGMVCGGAGCEEERGAVLDNDNEDVPARGNVDVLLATPGRLVDLLCSLGQGTGGGRRGGDGERSLLLSHLRYLVIDEADHLLSREHHHWLPRHVS